MSRRALTRRFTLGVMLGVAALARPAGASGDVTLLGIVNLTSRGRVWAEGGDVGHHHAAIRAHVSSRQTLKAVAREIR
jgi:hypothetical protein